MKNKINIERRRRILINTDPQKRCYNGCYFSTELIWSNWEAFESNVDKNKVNEKLKFWRELNDYAVGSRGESAKVEYRTNNKG